MSMMDAMGMMRCEDVLARLWDFLDGELDVSESEAVKQHLELCDRCYPQYDFQRAYFVYADKIQERDSAPPELRRRLFQKILEQDAKSEDGR